MLKPMNSWWEQVWMAIGQEFSDLGDPAVFARVCVRLLVAVVLGGLLGYEREKVGAAAGLRTHMLVAMGSALFVLVPLQAGLTMEDASRVIQGVIAGIGFLGAGAILKSQTSDEVVGLTTAASIWMTAAIGVAAGLGRESTAVLSTVFALVILSLLRKMVSKEKSGAAGGAGLTASAADASTGWQRGGFLRSHPLSFWQSAWSRRPRSGFPGWPSAWPRQNRGAGHGLE